MVAIFPFLLCEFYLGLTAWEAEKGGGVSSLHMLSMVTLATIYDCFSISWHMWAHVASLLIFY